MADQGVGQVGTLPIETFVSAATVLPIASVICRQRVSRGSLPLFTFSVGLWLMTSSNAEEASSGSLLLLTLCLKVTSAVRWTDTVSVAGVFKYPYLNTINGPVRREGNLLRRTGKSNNWTNPNSNGGCLLLQWSRWSSCFLRGHRLDYSLFLLQSLQLCVLLKHMAVWCHFLPPSFFLPISLPLEPAF